MFIGRQLCNDFLWSDDKKTSFHIQCYVIPRSAAVDVLKAVRFCNSCTGCRQSFTRLHRGFLSLLCLCLGVFYYFTSPLPHLRLEDFWHTAAFFNITVAQTNKCVSVGVFLERFYASWASFAHCFVPIFFCPSSQLSCIPLGSVDMAIREWTGGGHTSFEGQFNRT